METRGLEFNAKMLLSLKQYKLKNLLTWDGLSERAKISKSTLYYIKKRKCIGTGTLKKIKKYLGVDLTQYADFPVIEKQNKILQNTLSKPKEELGTEKKEELGE